MIDAHQHFWRIDRGDYGWLTPALAPIYRDFGPDDLAPILDRHGIERTILVQAAPTVAETRFLLEIAATTPFVAGVVGWADFEAPDAPEAIAALARDPWLVGLRPMVHDLPDPQWLARPSLAPAFEAMIAQRLVFDALVRPQHLPPLLHVVGQHPALRVVIDHAAKPALRSGNLGHWRDDLARLAAHDNVVCKLSGLVTEAMPGAGVEAFAPIVDTVLDLFGADRVLWGSDWPVVELAGGCDRWISLTSQLLARLPPGARDGILGTNAQRVYLER